MGTCQAVNIRIIASATDADTHLQREQKPKYELYKGNLADGFDAGPKRSMVG
jgi:hypothetical protein